VVSMRNAGLAILAFVAMLPAAASMQDPTLVTNPPERFAMRVLVSGLEGPWEVAWGPDQMLWITERTGRRVIRVNPSDGSRTTLVSIPEVNTTFTQDGLLGLAFHADFLRNTGNDFVYVAFTYDDAAGTALARRMAVRRYRYDAGTRTLVDPRDILTGLPTHTDHVGGRLAFGADRKLYVTVGDQGSNFGANICNENLAQALPTAAEVRARDWSHYQGKILRVELDGSIPADNPSIDGVRSHVFTWGHRNPLGLVVAPDGKLYESEHGPGSDDEVNLIEGGRNYGWPNVAGYRDDKSYVYANWSKSAPQPCASLSRGAAVPASVPTQAETAWNDPRFMAPLRTFFTVENGYDLRTIGSATIAPGGIDYYAGSAIPGWNRSLLALSLIRGAVYRLSLAADGQSIQGPAVEMFRSGNRYRDIAINPDGRTLYVATDVIGPSRNAADIVTQTLANPGSILEFRYTPQGSGAF
jgi:PQQ-dependent dehydrogenase (s-GDH family)